MKTLVELYRNFLNLDKITYDDKVWVFTKITTKKQIIKWGILCAESVLHIFEKEYPYDKRPFLALQAAKNYLINPSEENKKTAADAAYAAYADAAYAPAADAAADAAAYAADAACAAAYAADAADAACAAYAAYTAAAFNRSQQEQINLNLNLMLEAVC